RNGRSIHQQRSSQQFAAARDGRSIATVLCRAAQSQTIFNAATCFAEATLMIICSAVTDPIILLLVEHAQPLYPYIYTRFTITLLWIRRIISHRRCSKQFSRWSAYDLHMQPCAVIIPSAK